ncbi:hypothetical protein MLD38_000682 [Melastoma candidum]|uniref:Uncharacterized protein n=1 Tax=Melastoma candidum TaxID=119954 RepID=A0ACB9SAN5_9MYRT|nr:hypothetical protein MLD38_000682 [Melastoma candidum]
MASSIRVVAVCLLLGMIFLTETLPCAASPAPAHDEFVYQGPCSEIKDCGRHCRRKYRTGVGGMCFPDGETLKVSCFCIFGD